MKLNSWARKLALRTLFLTEPWPIYWPPGIDRIIVLILKCCQNILGTLTEICVAFADRRSVVWIKIRSCVFWTQNRSHATHLRSSRHLCSVDAPHYTLKKIFYQNQGMCLLIWCALSPLQYHNQNILDSPCLHRWHVFYLLDHEFTHAEDCRRLLDAFDKHRENDLKDRHEFWINCFHLWLLKKSVNMYTNDVTNGQFLYKSEDRTE